MTPNARPASAAITSHRSLRAIVIARHCCGIFLLAQASLKTAATPDNHIQSCGTSAHLPVTKSIRPIAPTLQNSRDSSRNEESTMRKKLALFAMFAALSSWSFARTLSTAPQDKDDQKNKQSTAQKDKDRDKDADDQNGDIDV